MLRALVLALDLTVLAHSDLGAWDDRWRETVVGLGDGPHFLNLVADTGTNATEQDVEPDAPAGECADRVVLKVKITILGKLGPPDEDLSPEEKAAKKDKASKWIFSSLLRSMLGAGNLSKTAVPSVKVSTKEPFSETEDGGRSPLERTIIDVDFPDTDMCSAQGMGKFVCRDYNGENEELITGFVRSLDIAKQYPAAAMEMASKAGLSTKSLITLRAAYSSGETTKSFCHWGRTFPASTIQGALMLPDCPANSVRCEERPHLCEEHEPLWKCKCTLGYDGNVTIPGLEAEVPQGPFHVEGECKAISGYCPLEGKYPLKLASGEDAKGVLGETATPACPDGFEASGSSECAESQSNQGMWSPTPSCNFLPSKQPPKPYCSAPPRDSFRLKGCRFCMGVEKGKEGPECDCEVDCDVGYRELRPAEAQSKLGKKECIAKEFSCPPASLNGTQCIETATAQATQLFCCDESWGANVPPAKLAERVCSEIKEDKECLTSSQAGAACCWSRSSSSCSVKAQEGQSPCAVAKRVLVADFEDLPRCVAPCANAFEESYLKDTNCGTCFPSGAGDCACEVTCKDTVRIGGGPEGSRTCEPHGDDFRWSAGPPACWPRPAPLQCPSVEAVGRKIKGCDCKAGQTCECQVSCDVGFALTSGDHDPTCKEKPLPPQVKACDTIANETKCLQSHAAANTPCCWRQEGFSGGGPCMAAGDERIRQDALPQSCAAVSFAEWEGLPTCTPRCSLELLREAVHATIDPSCENCVAGQECACTVQCEPGFEFVGGGKEGNRSCSVADLSLGRPPVCRSPQAAFGLDGGEPGRLPVCPHPNVANATSDCQCKASPDGCSCPIFCKYGYGNTKAEAPEGVKNCTVEEKPLAEGTCNGLTSEADCLSHAQDGEPCCFREQGLDVPCSTGDCKVCAPRYDPNMVFSPRSCAKSLLPTWEEMPECQPFCTMLDLISMVEKDTVVYEGDCSSCIAGQPCNCKISCAEGYVRVGGGREGPRSCTHSDLQFEEFPLCQQKEGKPECHALMPDRSLWSRDDDHPGYCSSCVAGDENCSCQVGCQNGYAKFTEIDEGVKKCHVDPDYALTPGSCAALLREEDCLKGSEDDLPCCWRGAGYSGGKSCAKRGSSQIDLRSPPDACAAMQGAKRDQLPECKQLCVNQFSAAPNVDEEGCEGCFVGEPCPCTVKCEVDTVQRSGEKGPKKCGDDENDPTSFGEPLVCEPRQPPKVPYCQNLVDPTYTLQIKGCKKCKAGDEKCSCDVSCRPGHKHTAGSAEGSKKCISYVFECPVRVAWDASTSQCTDDDTKEPTYMFCCPEAIGGKVELDGSKECSSLTSEKQCLKGKDLTTGEACCWRDTAFTDEGQKCAAHGSPVITNERRAHACANRPRILYAAYEAPPVCTEKCKNPYKASYRERLLGGGAQVDATGCDDCVPGDASCPCNVVCSKGLIHVGGSKEDGSGTRMCKDGKFPPAPTCMKPPEPPTCAAPRGHGLDVEGCAYCTPGIPCHCEVYCAHGMGSIVLQGKKECKKKPAELNEGICNKIISRELCISSWEDQAPCCYRRAGFGGVSYCQKQGSEAISSTPDVCAPLETAEFDDLPQCKSMCTIPFSLTERSYQATNCANCLADTPCDCKITCSSGFEFVGGQPEGPRGCTSWDLDLKDPPVCREIKQVTCTERNQVDLYQELSWATLELKSCERCAADPSCRCTASCAADHIPKPGSVQEGMKRCLELDVPETDLACEAISDPNLCAESVHDGKRCCWQEGSQTGWFESETGMCHTEGSIEILFRGPTRAKKPVCSSLKTGRFEEFPTCVPVCRHDFSLWNGLDYDEKACSRCTRDHFDEECKCSVSCAGGYHRVGADKEGPRGSCVELPWRAPACMKTPPARLCRPPDAPGLKVTGCQCQLGQGDCSCHVDCLDGYSITAGQPGELQCVEEAYTEGRNEGCSSDDRAECLSSLSLDNGPCCWRSAGFLTSGSMKCVTQDSDLISIRRLPDACGYTTKAVFRPVAGPSEALQCTPVCKNIFAELTDVEYENCDDCKPNQDCKCTVKCRAPKKALGGEAGIRRCLLNRMGRAEFEPAPVCIQPCMTPDHQSGALDVSRCMNDCVPGDKACECEVRCADGNERVDGGPEGPKSCVGLSEPKHLNLPICLPKCVKPDNQFKQLNTNKCASCFAGKECNCELNCYTQSSSSGAKNGRKDCKFVPGDQKTPAAAQWVPADGVGPPGAPSCLPPMRITVDDARSKKPLPDVTITIKMPYYPGSKVLRVIETLFTKSSKDTVEFTSEARDIYVTLEKEGYTTITRKLDRGKNCEDQQACEFHFALSEQLKGGQLYPEGCFIVGEPKNMEWDMRAVLEWDESPQDLDIWARYHDCYADVEKAYDCDGFKVYLNDGRTCKRRWFTRTRTRKKESEVCGMRTCTTNADGSTSMKTDGRPDCRSNWASKNQFNKWVFWNVRYTTDLHQRWKRSRIPPYTEPVNEWVSKEPAKSAKGWTDDNYIVLDVDEQEGRGPETISFKNVPPGLYQVVVNQWSNEGKYIRGTEVKNVAFGNPRVNLYIGGNSVRFECQISESCTKSSRLWNVVNIKVIDAGPVEGKPNHRKYQIRLMDEENTMKKLRRVELPTRIKMERGYFENYQVWKSDDWMGQEYFFEATQGTYTDKYLEAVCYGTCEPADETYKDCLASTASTRSRRLWANQSSVGS